MASPDTLQGTGEAGPAVCWCCGQATPADRLVHLGTHPEVAVCTRCAHALSKWAWELDDRDKASLAARARDAIRAVRKNVVRRGWHQHRLVGQYLRWLGKYTP